jgi:hypothetical protein
LFFLLLPFFLSVLFQGADPGFCVQPLIGAIVIAIILDTCMVLGILKDRSWVDYGSLLHRFFFR